MTNPAPDPDTAVGAGFLVGLATLLVVLLPVSWCAWKASASLAQISAVVDPGRSDLVGAITWTLATLLLVALPVLATSLVTRRAAASPVG